MQILNGDNIDLLKQLPDNSVDSIVTDPPYGLSFMGKKWDYDVPTVELWKECLRVLKPGGHLLAFAGTRTQHRMAVRIEDAGFEIRDMIAWVYGSGFPKSLNIGKAVDKMEGNEREVIGSKTHSIKGVIIAEQRGAIGAGAFGQEKTTDLTKGTSEREGRGTALKPAIEPITLARKPIEGTVAENCLKWGTGGINIDESRVGTEEITIHGYKGDSYSQSYKENSTKPELNEYKQVTGRFPANLILSDCEEVRECFPNVGKGNGKGAYNYAGVEYDNKDTSLFNGDKPQAPSNYNDDGNASRFFKSIIYQAKASKSERNMGLDDFNDADRIDYGGFHSEKGLIENNRNPENRVPMKNGHPTVKPIALMEYLIKMVTKKGGIVLDPFMGSGTTGIAAKKNGYNFIGMELDEGYHKIAEARINAVEETREREVSLFNV